MEVYYCPVCGTKISGDDVKSGLAVISAEKRVICKKCFADVAGAATAASAASAPKAFSPAKHFRAPVIQKARKPAPQSGKISIALGLTGILLAALFVFMFSNKTDKENKVNEPPKSASSAPEIKKLDEIMVSENKITAPDPHNANTPRDKELNADAALDTALHADPSNKVAALENFLKQYNDTSASARARVELHKLTFEHQVAASGSIVVGSMNHGDETWSYSNGDEYPGAVGSMEKDRSAAKEGSTSLKILADFSKGGGYVAASDKFSGSIASALSKVDFKLIKMLRFWVRSSECQTIGVRFSDATGQAHMQRLSFVPNGEWQRIEINKFTSGPAYQRWGGANDGAFHWPPTGINFVIEKGTLGAHTKGIVWINWVEFVLHSERTMPE